MAVYIVYILTNHASLIRHATSRSTLFVNMPSIFFCVFDNRYLSGNSISDFTVFFFVSMVNRLVKRILGQNNICVFHVRIQRGGQGVRTP